MDFGLGLVLSFTDNATAGINNAVNTLDRLTQVAGRASSSLDKMASLSALSVVSDQLGGSFLKAGSSILGLFGNLLNKARATGSEFENFRITLTALYKDEQKAEKAIGKLLDFSIKSPFEVDEVKDMLIVLQSQGVDAFNEVTGGITGARQETLSWIADLMAFKPDEATSRWKRALTNYIGSGEDRMLRNILDMGDIDQILGHEVGATVDERLNDIIEIVEKKNLQGLAGNLSKTWTGVASNIGDAFTKLYKSIADNGVFENLKGSFMSLSGAILELDNAQLEALGKTLAEGLNTIIKPLTYAVGKLNGFINGIIDLCQTNPDLVKLGMVLLAIGGAVLTFIGLALKATSAMSGVSLILLTFGKSFKDIGGLLKVGVLKIMSVLLPLIATIGIMSFVWKNDIAGIKTNTKNFVSNLVTSFKTAKDAVNGDVGDLTNTLTELRNKGDFFSNITIGIMRVMHFGKALSDAWGDYTLSEDNFLKAKELGILPLIEAILDLKYRFEHFAEGFKEGWGEIQDIVVGVLNGITEGVKGTQLEGLVTSLTDFFNVLSSGDPQTWYEVGKTLGELVALASIFTFIYKVGSFIVEMFGKLGGVIGIVSKFLSPVITLIKFVGGLLAGINPIVVAIIAVVSLVVYLVRKYWDEIVAVLSQVGSWIFDNIITPIVNFFTTYIFPIIEKVVEIILKIIEIATTLFSVFMSWLLENVINPFLTWFGGIVEGIKEFFEPLVGFFKGVWDSIINLFTSIGTVVADLISSAVRGAVNSVIQGAVNIINGFISALNFAIGIINAIPGVDITKLTRLEIPQLAQGGVVDRPTLSVIGEAGREAVVPLENNTGWVAKVADMLASEMRVIKPVNSGGYLTPSASRSTQMVQSGSTDNSVVIQQGAIQINVQSATDEEAQRLAKKIMDYIKRQQELNRMVNYA